ncbi:MAG: SLBB domain-containing protein [Anaerovoracaceae bacterium]
MTGAKAQSFSAGAQPPWDEEDNPASAQRRSDLARSGSWQDNDTLDEIHPLPLTLADLEKFTKPGGAIALETLAPTAIETMYSNRAGAPLTLFGYDLFHSGQKPSGKLPSGLVGDDYILSHGDRIEIVAKGQENIKKTYEINSRGQLITDHFTTVNANGKTLGEITGILSGEARRLHNVEINLSLSAPRQIDVLVIGDVVRPGRATLTPFHSVLDALQEAGGIQRTGSLRRIKLVRSGKSEFIDLYNVMMQGGTGADGTLREGDRIIVPPIGPTVAVAGAVKRPAIYEIRRGETLSALEMLGLAGGVLAPGSNRFIRLGLTADGQEIVEDVTNPSAKSFGDGGILDVAQAQEKRARNIELSGHTRAPGQYDIQKTGKLSDLLQSDKIFGDALYPLLGVIERNDRNSLTKSLIEFSPRQVLRKNHDRKLEEGDVVHLFSMQQIRRIGQAVAKEPLLKSAAHHTGGGGDDALHDGMIISFLEERSVFVRGAVRQPGAYPVADGTDLQSLIASAGGTTIEADKDKVEVTARPKKNRQGAPHRRIVSLQDKSGASLRISAGDTVRINQKFNRVEEQSIALYGEVRHPGRYDLAPGDTLLSLIERAGGLNDIAYPDGVIFSRASERKQEESRYQAQARDLEMKLAEMMRGDSKDKRPDMEQVRSAQTVIAQLRGAKAVGRITVEADPAKLIHNPDLDILLEGGDRIYIPRRPLTVRVGGEVLSPAALQFRKGKTAQNYIEEAGGTTYYADKDRAFAVFPDGSARPLSVSPWKQGITMIPPGSTIIVPRDPKPFNFLESAEKISTILANIALTGFYIDDLRDD